MILSITQQLATAASLDYYMLIIVIILLLGLFLIWLAFGEALLRLLAGKRVKRW